MEATDLNILLEPTQDDAASIKSIDATTVHKICSGQVVLNLATAVKELVENALDAGATSIEIKFKDHGSTAIDVSDNGKGIHPSDFEGLALKHHTSKLKEFEDLVKVQTFGFRGEALSSMAALGNLIITTRCSSETLGSELKFSHKGTLVKQKPTHRQVGTTVSLENIFFPLAVRRKEFLRNIKKEFSKMMHILYSYCIIATNVRFQCSNQCTGKSKQILVTTNGYPTVKENVAAVFTSKQLALLEFKTDCTSEKILDEFGLTQNSEAGPSLFTFEGLISSCMHGCGRSAADIQYFFVNNRPCDSDKVKSLINSVYHSYNMHQCPVFILHVKTQEDNVDINVTPDKRKILVSQEKLLLASIKSSLVKLFDTVVPTFNSGSILEGKSSIPEYFKASTPCQTKSVAPQLTQSSSPFSKRPADDVSISPIKKYKKLDSPDKTYSPSQNSVFESSEMNCSISTPKSHIFSSFKSMENIHSKTNEFLNSLRSKKSRFKNSPRKSVRSNVSIDTLQSSCEIQKRSNCSRKIIYDGDSQNLEQSEISLNSSVCNFDIDNQNFSNIDQEDTTEHVEESIDISMNYSVCSDDEIKVISNNIKSNTNEQISINNVSSKSIEPVIITDEEFQKPSNLKKITVNFCMNKLKSKLKYINQPKQTKIDGRKFTAKILPSESCNAEGELRKQLTKDMFSQMQIIGQFNLGFIIAYLSPDLFIIDQHATDEKYNFESLENTCTLQQQPLIVPQTLSLTSVNQSILLENMHIFAQNGFTFFVDETLPSGKKAKLISIPHSKGWEFGIQDIEEMIFMLSDAPGVHCRPSRVRKMFASRACRQSVMIGTSLSHRQMKELILHMGEIEQPWNCPHGRPTIRHLINLNLVDKFSRDFNQ